MVGLGRILSGLKASEAGLKITSNNLTNVNTSGYKRQRLNQSEAVSTGTTNYFVGLGVKLDEVQQIYSSLKEEIYQESLAKLGELDAKDKVYDYIQTLTGTTVDGGMFKESVENMWTSINSLATKDAMTVNNKSNTIGSLNSLKNISITLSFFFLGSVFFPYLFNLSCACDEVNPSLLVLNSFSICFISLL